MTEMIKNFRILSLYDKEQIINIDKKDLSTAKRNATRFLFLASVFCERKSERAFGKEMMNALES